MSDSFTVPHDATITVPHAENYDLVFRQKGTWIFTVSPEGVVTVNPDLTPDEASKGAWDAIVASVNGRRK